MKIINILFVALSILFLACAQQSSKPRLVRKKVDGKKLLTYRQKLRNAVLQRLEITKGQEKLNKEESKSAFAPPAHDFYYKKESGRPELKMQPAVYNTVKDEDNVKKVSYNNARRSLNRDIDRAFQDGKKSGWEKQSKRNASNRENPEKWQDSKPEKEDQPRNIKVAQKEKTKAKYIKYRLKRGDTLYSLARRYRVSVSVIKRINRIKNTRNLKVGRVLKIPRINKTQNAKQRRAKIRKRSGISRKRGIPVFIYPIKGKLLSGFGPRRRSPFSKRYTFHPGIDLKGVVGTPIRASASGVVVFSGARRGYGRVVKIKHKNGFMTVYAHNRVNYVYNGQRVKRGKIIARVGMTGYTTGSHLHFEIRYKNKPKNPLLFLRKYVTYK